MCNENGLFRNISTRNTVQSESTCYTDAIYRTVTYRSSKSLDVPNDWRRFKPVLGSLWLLPIIIIQVYHYTHLNSLHWCQKSARIHFTWIYLCWHLFAPYFKLFFVVSRVQFIFRHLRIITYGGLIVIYINTHIIHTQ